MAFRDFKQISDVQKAYQIRYQLKSGLFSPSAFEPSTEFTTKLELLSNSINIFASEQTRKQAIIWPMLSEVYLEHTNNLTLWTEEAIAAPNDTKLSGTPDYFIATRSPLGITVISKPLLIIVEAKQDNFTQGWGQCLAAMVAAQKINETSEIDILGIVTTGQMWQFGRLQADLFEQYERLVRREEAFGYINALVTQAEIQAEQELGSDCL